MRPITLMLLLFVLPISVASAEEAIDVSGRVDALVAARWVEAGVAPAAPATDAAFLRRVYLDLAGRIPTAEEAEAFFDSTDARKRERLVEQLLGGDDFPEHWARQLALLLMGRERMPLRVDPARFEGWLRDKLARNTSYDRLVRDVVTASGNPIDSPAVNYFLRFDRKPEDIAESVASSFLGVSIGCARCHDHPYEPWTQEDFFGTAAAFAELDFERPSRADRRARRAFRREVETIQKERADGEMSPEERRRMLETFREESEAVRRTLRLTDVAGKRLEVEIDGQPQSFPVRFLDGTAPAAAPRSSLADWIVSADNPHFARATVNRVWEALFGRGLVDPVDAFGTSNPPSHPQVLDLLAKDFTENGFDLRRLFTVLVMSETYQLSSVSDGELPAPDLFAVARPRRMSPEQLFESFVTLGGLEGRARFDERREIFQRLFVFLFDTDAVNDVEIAQGTIPQSLFLLNGRLTNRALRSRRRDVDDLFLAALSRFPTDEERSELGDFLEAGGPRARDDLLWALVNSSEFLMVH